MTFWYSLFQTIPTYMVSKSKNTPFQNFIVDLIANARSSGCFIFKVEHSIGAVQSLRIQSNSVPNVPGIYFLFCESDNSDDEKVFIINNTFHTLLYFGKAGQKKDGTINKSQKMKDRINNVISDPARGLKDVKRGLYWEILLNELVKEHFKVIWIETKTNCVTVENSIYDALQDNKIKYPYLNKKRGKHSSQ